MISSEARKVGAPGPRRSWLVALMLASMALVVGLAVWDAARESTAALQDFQDEQATLAATAATALSTKLGTARLQAMAVARALDAANLTSNDTPRGRAETRRRVEIRFNDPNEPLRPPPALGTRSPIYLEMPLDERRVVDVTLAVDDLLADLRWIEQPGRRLLLHRAQYLDFIDLEGHEVRADDLAASLERGVRPLRLSRPEAAALGLPTRMAVAGLRTFDAGPLGLWGVAVVTTAERVRDREQRARHRLILVIVLAAGLVGAFGGVALAQQRKELLLSREVALSEMREQADERLRRADKLATMGALATGIAHEVSTPLGVILGRAEQLLPRVQEDERAKLAVAAITAQTERIGVVIRAFLDLARGAKPSLRRVRANDLASACAELVQHRFEKTGVHLDLRPRAGAACVACDPQLLEQAIVNLLLNACDASKPGDTVVLEVDVQPAASLARERASAPAAVTFAVDDEGTGITEAEAMRATEPFFTTKPAGKGTGLGLAIASEIVKHHQGSLTLSPRLPPATPDDATRAPGELTSEVKGTRARIELPLAPEDGGERAPHAGDDDDRGDA